MPYMFSDEEIEKLAEQLAILLLPKLLSAMKSKATWTVNQLQGEHYTAAQVSEMFQVSKQTIYRLAAEGNLPSVKVGKNGIRFERYAIEQAREAGVI
jgi:excisionase family DNA binding protein